MKAKELIDILSKVSPDTEVITGTWNGHVDTYTVLDKAWVMSFDEIYPDFFGTPEPFDERMLKIRSKDVVYLDSLFDSTNKDVIDDRRIVWHISRILHMHRSTAWKHERIMRLLEEYEKN